MHHIAMRMHRKEIYSSIQHKITMIKRKRMAKNENEIALWARWQSTSVLFCSFTHAFSQHARYASHRVPGRDRDKLSIHVIENW